ncbi:hypothetical protein RRG08_040075 [Elysia crispata]|uniref:Formin FH3 domain-containing protein n=1 Tax=Elysia crispata TaxID=231223 RepID=A0AAE0XVU5_9GAST|nr:hypothetical protein RRG08_040075 [Elysia crispata]
MINWPEFTTIRLCPQTKLATLSFPDQTGRPKFLAAGLCWGNLEELYKCCRERNFAFEDSSVKLTTTKRKKYRFSCILDEIRCGDNVPYKTNLLEFINCLIIYSEDVAERVRVRNEFYGLRLKEVLNELR